MPPGSTTSTSPIASPMRPGGLTEEVADSLRALGHAIQERRGTSGDVQAIMVLPDGTLVGYVDPRRGGLAAGY